MSNQKDKPVSAEDTISASEARASFNDILSRVGYGEERLIITRNGKPAAALISVADLELLERLEDAYWGEVASERIKASREAGEQPLKWDDFKHEYGL